MRKSTDPRSAAMVMPRTTSVVGVSRWSLSIDLLGDLNGVVDLDAEIAHGALDVGMSE
jgi:hypothetical protein